MLKRSMISAGFLGAFVVLAFGSGSFDPDSFDSSSSSVSAASSHDSHGACLRYVDRWNALECVPEAGHLKPETMCMEELKTMPVDMSGYYDCLSEKIGCDGSTIISASGADCPQTGG